MGGHRNFRQLFPLLLFQGRLETFGLRRLIGEPSSSSEFAFDLLGLASGR